MKLIAIDFGEKSGYSLWTSVEHRRDPDLSDSGTIDNIGPKSIYKFLSSLHLDMLVLEDWYIGSNKKGIKTLARRYNMWLLIAELLGLDVHDVPAITWQSGLNIKRGDKNAAYAFAKYIMRNSGRTEYIERMTQHEADAICLGYWATINKIGGFE